MAAFINALAEEGSRKDCLDWAIKMRVERGFDETPRPYSDFDGWEKNDLIAHISHLWDMERKGETWNVRKVCSCNCGERCTPAPVQGDQVQPGKHYTLVAETGVFDHR